MEIIQFQPRATFNAQRVTTTQVDLSSRLDEIAASEESARSLINCLLHDYGYQEVVYTFFPFLAEEEQQRLIMKAFGNQ